MIEFVPKPAYLVGRTMLVLWEVSNFGEGGERGEGTAEIGLSSFHLCVGGREFFRRARHSLVQYCIVRLDHIYL